MIKATCSLGIATLAFSFNCAHAATVAEVFNGEMLGTNQRYFESVAGIPRQSFGNDHTFKVQGCTIIATIESDSVTKLKLDIGRTCQADLTTFIDSFAPAPGKPLTFGSFDAASGGGLVYSADCLSLCGNAYDPSVYAHWEGPRALGFMEVLLEVKLTSDQAINAADQWQAHMVKAKGEDFVSETRFNCDPQFSAQANAAFEKVQVTSVTVGTGLISKEC